MKLHVGMDVMIKPNLIGIKNYLEEHHRSYIPYVTGDMVRLEGAVDTIKAIDAQEDSYAIELMHTPYYWHPEYLEPTEEIKYEVADDDDMEELYG